MVGSDRSGEWPCTCLPAPLDEPCIGCRKNAEAAASRPGPERWRCKRCGKERRRGECLHCGNEEAITDELRVSGLAW
jgi:hypothetical protein